ncbi:hypothetical protein GCM10010277_86650 [Streptomyces longisporoflavus]|nr:hypothetical protein GCM10010277_86650 [Streptomyces longisporoflavus]
MHPIKELPAAHTAHRPGGCANRFLTHTGFAARPDFVHAVRDHPALVDGDNNCPANARKDPRHRPQSGGGAVSAQRLRLHSDEVRSAARRVVVPLRPPCWAVNEWSSSVGAFPAIDHPLLVLGTTTILRRRFSDIAAP